MLDGTFSPWRGLRAALVVAHLILVLFVLGCATTRDKAASIGVAGGFEPIRFETAPFVLLGWLRPARAHEPGGAELAVYIEGDGLAWLRRTQPSSDPTPTDPVGLRLAVVDPSPGPVLYLGRPCQYTLGSDRRGCSVADWTSDRFSSRAVAALDAAIDQAKAAVRADTVALYGYSGGAALAALLAERRGDVRFLGTVAGNLDPGLWTTLLHDTPLRGSLNPVDDAAATGRIAQLHVIGGADGIVSADLLASWCRHLPPDAPVTRVTAAGLGHAGPWEAVWARALRRARGLAAASPP